MIKFTSKKIIKKIETICMLAQKRPGQTFTSINSQIKFARVSGQLVSKHVSDVFQTTNDKQLSRKGA